MDSAIDSIAIPQQVKTMNANAMTNANLQSKTQFHSFENFAELSKSLVTEWVNLIDSATAAQRPASFALAGGSTPAPIYRELDQALAQRAPSDVRLTATDERWVHDTDPQSNEGLFKKCLPLSYGKQWNLVSLKNAANTPEVAMEAINERLHQQLPARFSAVLLGMGADGHIASLFPGAPLEADGLDCLAAVHPQTHQTRISLSLPRLLQSEKIWLVITGNEKRQVFENALTSNLPITNLLKQAQCRIDVFWCP
ncbi:6-phosphogluconolactonase [Undibacterium seohonense]|uniref:6-phosphogluconolactonase n=1 Tax=Undibacterium seohonense TaxID=1344950 RepID=A0ABR6X9D4_9BURK|nr:6-phosphogluconolactonase [Undibacterium seohonense]MBC3809554.1 6-phosphogluconolactonase [Undibacterium seohonense]